MDRRSVLKYVAALTGSSILAPISGSVLAQGLDLTRTKSSLDQLQFFDVNRFELLTQIMDVILPRTDSPSASDVKVNYIMDNMFNQIFPAGYQANFLTLFAELKRYLESKQFTRLLVNEQVQLLTDLELNTADNAQARKAYMDIKQQTITYYLSTEEVAENHLNYLPIPGRYVPSISVKEVGGKAWAE
ncbi:gluconate 2-dehydrogenase subunit 3 family protein [Algibacillus agarilyticus]|uniref:gluconate 2-dehydrogenase subunit 3 family protein n=1 Tax=Algibacillus agarilyticus TaxID=2234133 RepID=UPI000DD0B253|nr:gluconate 2-dehydrogenase subunit 3 family protein [Algibacillus agarilyticus]